MASTTSKKRLPFQERTNLQESTNRNKQPNILSLTHNQLVQECKNLGCSTRGSTAALQFRLLKARGIDNKVKRRKQQQRKPVPEALPTASTAKAESAGETATEISEKSKPDISTQKKDEQKMSATATKSEDPASGSETVEKVQPDKPAAVTKTTEAMKPKQVDNNKECKEDPKRQKSNTKRMRVTEKPRASSPKRQKTTNKRSVGDTMICPITCFLPHEPVMAEDGHVYEKWAFEEYVRKQRSDKIKSPMTGHMIGTNLLPTVQFRNTIEMLVETGAIEGHLAEAWKNNEKEIRQEKDKKELLLKARRGNPRAMETLAENYYSGLNDFEQDAKQAFQWFTKADAVGSAWGTACMGKMLVDGTGVEPNQTSGVMHLGVAAGQGCDWAAYKLGIAFCHGKYGIPVDKSKAIIWLKKCLSGTCEYQYMSEGEKINAKQALDNVIDSWLAS